MNIIVDSQIYIPAFGLEKTIIQKIKNDLEIKNYAKEVAKKELIPGWFRMPDKIRLWDGEDTIVAPRGYAKKLSNLLDRNGIDFIFDDRRIYNRCDYSNLFPVDLRDYQEEAVEKILTIEQGIWKAPPGAGKTVAVLEAIRRSMSSALVITDKTNIAEQWRERSRHFLGYEPGLLGDGSWDIRPFTIALQQTLWSKISELDNEFWNMWGFV